MKLIISIILTLILGGLLLSTHDSFLLAGGSDSLDVVTLPTIFSQLAGLILFFIALVHFIKVRYGNMKIGRLFKVLFILLSFITVLASGHTHTISGKQHAFVDQWFHVPVQTLTFDPRESIENYKYKSGVMFVSLYKGEAVKQTILTGPLFWGISQRDVIKKLKDFGVVEY